MACDPDEGLIRQLAPDFTEKDLKPKEVLFTKGELIVIKGCVFSLENIFPNPENTMILKCQPAKLQEGNMI